MLLRSALIGLLQVGAIDTFFNQKWDIADTKDFSLSVETNWNLGLELYHKGQPSEYDELSDDYISSINAKQWVKIDFRAFDAFV